ncbi:hypothetical protein AQJ84_15785 [Streptomyces resistomycificus]|uniref:Uncharacterized protein n=1 Tax=Streptomyces resistomycificus TaxID=67356 RepID=A0A0L8KVV0_9ACTN|nr:hypothetical protein ADK37_35515 [Streptomyces resistomycificus]KUN98155.1 hypothetical protein AQJ84_15785 [Streptomyces resistomycificus]
MRAASRVVSPTGFRGLKAPGSDCRNARKSRILSSDADDVTSWVAGLIQQRLGTHLGPHLPGDSAGPCLVPSRRRESQAWVACRAGEPAEREQRALHIGLARIALALPVSLMP